MRAVHPVGWAAAGGAVLCLHACIGGGGPGPASAPGEPTASASVARPTTVTAPVPPPAPPPREPVVVFEPGRPPRVVEHVHAEEDGFTVVDLSNNWAPFVFTDCSPGLADCRPNTYRSTFIALANERPPPEGASNPEGRYLELFGIPPSLSVLRARVIEDEGKQCVRHLSYDALREFRGFLSFQPGTSQSWIRQQAETTRDKATRAARRLHLAGPEALAAVPEQRAVYQRFHEADVRLRALIEAQDRLDCEGIIPRAGRPVRGNFDWKTHQALATFERKNRIFGWGFIGRDTIDDLRRTPAEGHHQTFIRILEERIADAAGILEDGSASKMRGVPTTFRTVDGREEPLRNLVEEYRNAALRAMGLETAPAFTAWIQRLSDEELEGFRIAVRFPPRPAYYGPTMDLSVEVDRGDVWYDFPWDATGNPVTQPVSRRPHLTLYTTYNGQKIPIVYYGTTIGGWRSERINGQDYYSYKNSDVGPRVWRQILAAPVWIPPESTPLSGLVTRGRGRRRVNYDEFGPGYASAYGLVAAINVQEIPRDDGTVGYFDNGIRVHGSQDYMSIMQRHSHGCHRLYNHLALRLFQFVIQHRAHTRSGQTAVNYGRNFEYEGRPYRINLTTRGYLFELDPPVPVTVNLGRIMGSVMRPPEEPVRKPGVVYQPETEAWIDPATGEALPMPVDAHNAPGAPPLAPGALPPSPAVAPLAPGAPPPVLIAPPAARTAPVSPGRPAPAPPPRTPIPVPLAPLPRPTSVPPATL